MKKHSPPSSSESERQRSDSSAGFSEPAVDRPDTSNGLADPKNDRADLESGRYNLSNDRPDLESGRYNTPVGIARVTGPRSANKAGSKHPRRKLLWLLAMVPVVIIIAAVSIYAHFQNTYKKQVFVEQSFVDSWDQLTDPNASVETDPSGSVVTPDPSANQPPMPSDIPVEPPKLSDVDIKNDPIIKKERMDPDIENLLIIGIDGADIDNEGHRSDTMLIVSINKKTQSVKLVSIMRDIWTYFPNRYSWNKINASYAFGGPGQTVNIINEGFGLDVQQYVVMDFSGYRDIIDLLGGVTVKLTSQEASKVPGISGAGTYTLSGDQALAYSRIRKIDSDFVRVQRQRNVLLALFSSMRKQDPVTQYNLAVDALEYMRSNIPANDITGRFLDLVVQIDSSMDQMTIPETGMYTVHDEGTWYMSIKWEDQKESLHEFLYGE